MDVAERYAQSLFNIASKQDPSNPGSSLKSVHESLNACFSAFLKGPGFLDLLDGTAVPLKERHLIIDRTIGAVRTNPALVVNLFHVLVNRGRVSVFPMLKRSFDKLVDRKNKIIEVSAWSAVPLDEDTQKYIVDRIEKTHRHVVKMTWTVDKDLLGGLIFEVQGKRVYMSLSTDLDQLRHRLLA